MTLLNNEYSKTKGALVEMASDIMEGVQSSLNEQYLSTELDNVLMMPHAPKIEPEQVLFGFVFTNNRPNEIELMTLEMRFHAELAERGIQATFRTRPLKDYSKRDAWVFFVVAEALTISH